MPVTPPTVVSVAYESPHLRALSAAQRTGLAALVSAILLGVLPLGITFVQHGDFSRASVQALLTAAGVVVLTVILAYVQKLSEAKADDAKAEGVPLAPEPPATPTASVFAPPITAATLRDLLATVDVLQQWQRPVAPNTAIGHRVVTAPSAITPVQQFDAPVKRSHHAAKVPVVPLETVSDH